jgi:putative flippase GtrA
LNLIFQFLRFGIVSLIGLVIDVAGFLLFVQSSIDYFYASLLSSLIAVSFVFLVSGYWIFRRNKFSIQKYIFWVFYQVLNIIFFSWAIEFLCLSGYSPVIAKVSVVPASFTLNFFIMRLIAQKKNQ